MKRASVVFVMLAMVIVMLGCQYVGTVQQKWNELTPDKRARIILSQMQDQVSDLFYTGRDYVAANPQYNDQWKKEIVPWFDDVNKGINIFLDSGRKGKLTPEEVYRLQPLINRIIARLTTMGAIKAKKA